MAKGNSLCAGYDKLLRQTAAYHDVKLESRYFDRMVGEHREVVKILVSMAFGGRMADAVSNLF